MRTLRLARRSLTDTEGLADFKAVAFARLRVLVVLWVALVIASLVVAVEPTP